MVYSLTVHKVHGPIIIEKSVLPTEQLRDEVQKARNKEFKRYRKNFSRKLSHQKANQDILNSFLITSDTIISSMLHIQKRSRELILFIITGNPRAKTLLYY